MKKALVTGGGGFLGGAIVEGLLSAGWEVRSLARGAYPALAARGVEVRRGSVTEEGAVDRAVEGVDAVFHVAAMMGIWGPYDEFYLTNVVGTRHLMDAMRRHGVGKLVFTSSPSVVFSGEDMEGVDESVGYPSHYEGAYSETKAIAEREVLAANSPTLATVALRPHLIWGPGDTNITPRLVARARSGRLRRIGTEDKRVDATYIDNAASAHLSAVERLAPGSPCAGKAYFIGNGEPIATWTLINAILAAHGAPQVTRSVPVGVAYAAAGLLEGVHGLFGLPGEPAMTRFVARELATAHWFDLGAARRDLGYQPAVSTEEGLGRLREHAASAR